MSCVKSLVPAACIRNKGFKNVAARNYSDKRIAADDRHRSYTLLAHHLGSINQGAVAAERNGWMIHYRLHWGIIQYCGVTQIAVRDDAQERTAGDDRQLVDAMLSEKFSGVRNGI